MKQVITFFKSQTVLSIASLLAMLSAFVVKPDRNYLGYVDLRTLAILFSLMAVVAGFQNLGIFHEFAGFLLSKVNKLYQVMLVLVLLCFFLSMIITNDVALITFVPFTFVVLHILGKELLDAYAIPIVCMQTIAANLGSMLTPLGNPQNLYLYGISKMEFGEFVLIMLPYTAMSLLLLTIWIAIVCSQKGVETGAFQNFKSTDLEHVDHISKRKLTLYLTLFVLCLLCVMRVITYPIAFFAVLIGVSIFDRKTLKQLDYSLLLTFVAFFIFIGNLGRMNAFSNWISQVIENREVLVSALVSQVTSNVPAALLLSGFTDQYKALMIGLNIGGLGTMIASMASLISFRVVARELGSKKGKYFLYFTVANVIFLLLLLGFYFGLKKLPPL